MKQQSLPLRELLEGALYYPSSGTDGDPVKYMGALIQSFVYVDYGYSRASFLEALQREPFAGYRILGSRSVSEAELETQGWRAPPLSPDEINRVQNAVRRLRAVPFCEWVVFERLPSMPVEHGPRRFSLLQLCADGVAAFQALYVDKALRPGAIAVIQPGHGFGGNWADFTDPTGPLGRVVASNPAGLPPYMLAGGLGPRSHNLSIRWPQYSRLIRWYPYPRRGEVGIWALGE